MPGISPPVSVRAPARRMLCCFAALGLLGAVTPAFAVEPLTELAFVRRVLDRAELQDLLQGQVDRAESAASVADLWPNPTFDVERDRIDSTAGRSTEQKYRLSQTFDISGRRGLRREAGEQRVGAVRAGNASRRLEIAAEARLAFHEGASQERRVALLDDWRARLLRIDDILGKLYKGGEVAGYDQRRARRELLVAEARLAEAKAGLARQRERIAALGSLAAESLSFVENGSAVDLPPIETFLLRIDQSPDLRALAASAEAHELERKAADREWIPDLTIGVGKKRIDAAGRSDTGNLLSVSIPLPLFDRGQASSNKAGAEARVARGEYQLARSRTTGEVRGVWQQARLLREATLRHGESALKTSRELIGIAEAAYRGGEAGILELLDAHRAAAEAEVEAVELQLKARRARIELDTLTGVTE